MSALTFKLKILKGTIKDWEKMMTLAKAKEAKEIELAIHDLLTTRISGILTDDEATQPS